MERNILQVTPVMNVMDVGEAVAFFVELLGFRALVHAERYAYVERDGAGVRIQWHDVPKEIGTPHGGFAYYFDMRDLDALHAERAPRLAALPPGHVYGPVDQGYAQRELMIRAPDGNLVVFGQSLRD